MDTDALRQEFTEALAAWRVHPESTPNLRDFGLDKRAEFEAAVDAHRAETDRLYEVARVARAAFDAAWKAGR